MNFQLLPVTALQPSPLNPRKHFDPAKLEELAASFAGAGIIEPLVVRPVNGHYELVAGERRWRAAKIAKLEAVPTIVRELTDDQVLEMMVIENGQRDDLDPIEEAQGYRALIDSNPGKYTAAAIAERIGRSEKYVWDRLKLLELIPEARQHLEHGRITAGHAILIARLKPEDQKRVIATTVVNLGYSRRAGGLWEHQDGVEFDPEGEKGKFATLKPVTVRELEAWIAEHVRFDVEHFAKAAPLDFGETAANVQEALAQPGRGKKLISITCDYNATREAASSGDERTYGATAWKRADGNQNSKTCEHSVLGVVVAGREYGRSFDVCIARDRCQVHWKAEIAEREKNRKLREKGETVKAQKREESSDARWEREQRERARRAEAWDAIRERALMKLGEALKKEGPSQRVVDAVMKTIRLWNKADQALFARVMGKVTAKNVAIALLFGNVVDDLSRDHDEFVRLAKFYGVELKDLEGEYRAALAPPKPVQTSAQPKAAAKGKKKAKR